MTRMGLNWAGSPIERPGPNTRSAFKVIFCIVVVFWIIYSVLAGVSAAVESTTGGTVYVPYYILGWVYVVFFLFIVIRTRGYIREKYGIREKYCEGCQDCCLGFWCPCCTVAQMARHTADYRTYSAGCCTETGLAGGAPDIV